MVWNSMMVWGRVNCYKPKKEKHPNEEDTLGAN